MRKPTLRLFQLLTRYTWHCAELGLLAALATVARAQAPVTQAWVQRYDGPAANYDDLAQAAAMDGSGNVVVTGSSYNGANYDYYTAKYAVGDGALLWERRYNGPANSDDHAYAVAVDRSGNVVVTGYSNNGGGYYDNDSYTAKYAAADGALLWEKRYNGPANSHDAAIAVAVDGGRNAVVAGSSEGDLYTAKYAAVDGALLWEQRYNGPANSKDRADAVAVDGSGNVVVTGYSFNGPSEDYSSRDYYTAKYAAADGALLWEQRYNGPANGDDSSSAVAMDGSGNVVVTGSSEGAVYTAKYAAADGALLWEKRYPGGSGWAVAIDGTGNVVVAGSSATIKYLADGTGGWTNNGGEALGVDGSGNVVVARSSEGDLYTAKYAAADGALLWKERYDGPAHGNDRLGSDSQGGGYHSLALGLHGMVAITGSSSGSGGTSDYATVVYRELPPPTSFADWAAGFSLSGVAAAADADSDSDGLPNGAEFILGGNPAAPNTSGSPTASISDGNIILTFPRDDASETPDVTLTVETGTDLATWPEVFAIGPNTAASSPGVSISENGAAPDTITVTIPQSADRAKFVRLHVTIAP